ncbi:MAG: hypothetical protein K0S09_331 [Sphingobacteriaceae bacterium]|jgi:hypothetical protein|nr:hypothetical protein [Sphingobacteriaceae bacterium]
MSNTLKIIAAVATLVFWAAVVWNNERILQSIILVLLFTALELWIVLRRLAKDLI